MTFPVIVTRTAPGVYKTVERLRALGVRPLAVPLLKVKFKEKAEIPSNAVVTIFTSVNGVRSYAQLTKRRDTRVYCIGETTRAAAEEMGWTVLASSQGGTKELIRLVQTHIKPEDGLVIHPTNAKTAAGMTEKLKVLGYTAQLVHCYTAERRERLPKTAVEALKVRDCVVLLYSSEAALNFLNLFKDCRNNDLRIIGFSENIVSVLRSAGFRRLWVAKNPTEEAMLKILNLPEFLG